MSKMIKPILCILSNESREFHSYKSGRYMVWFFEEVSSVKYDELRFIIGEEFSAADRWVAFVGIRCFSGGKFWG